LIDEPTNHLISRAAKSSRTTLQINTAFGCLARPRVSGQLYRPCHCDPARGRRRPRNHLREWLKLEREQAFEQRRSDGLKREIRALSRASAQRREGALARERDKAPHVDKGYVGHRAAKQMKRALAIERRIERQIEERKSLLRNAEKSRTLKLDADRQIIAAATAKLAGLRDGRAVRTRVVQSCERRSARDPRKNGSGKSS
jgi:lincosamide and streptogramin A transport system ATP-binding/permease protein